MTDNITAKLSCKNCGGVPEIEENPTDDSIVKCKSCGQVIGTYGQIKAQVRKVAFANIRKIAKSTFRKKR